MSSSLSNKLGCISSNERLVPAVSYKLAGWFWEFPNTIGKFRKGFRKKMKVYGNGPIRRKKMPAFRQAALEYPRQISDWEIIFTAGSRPNIYFLGKVFNTMHSWRLCLLGLWFRPFRVRASLASRHIFDFVVVEVPFSLSVSQTNTLGPKFVVTSVRELLWRRSTCKPMWARS
jgi:hypothetical protein